MKFSAEIKLWGTTVGAISLEDSQKTAYFEYDTHFLSTGIQVSPIMMPLRSGVFRFPDLSYESFFGLPGLLSDSLPDKFGNELISVYLAKQGRLLSSFNAVERLCYTGNRGMGALEYYPVLNDENKTSDSEQIVISELVELASLVLSNRKNLSAVLDEANKRNLSKSLQKIISLGTSAGGARAKAVIALNPKTNEVRSGQIEGGSGFEHWLIKFSGVTNNRDKEEADKTDFGVIEYAYYLMALSCGISMNECHLLKDGKNRHFMTKRFDRFLDETGRTQKLHMQSLGAMGHFDFNQAGSASYEQAFTIMNALSLPHSEKAELFRRMIFNVLACNCDDHVKNISFLMDKTGAWHLSPAYDVAFAYNPAGAWTSSHQMTINGKRKNITQEDYENCAKIAGLTNAEKNRIYAQVSEGVSKWRDFAEKAGVSEEDSRAIGELLGSTK
ncbi:MAG: type II toxin-antitoxin system HipA family toxin [Treponema sp.]|nr:type II toxin-antitoxin system HipA family toxin [Treponema sp.]